MVTYSFEFVQFVKQSGSLLKSCMYYKKWFLSLSTWFKCKGSSINYLRVLFETLVPPPSSLTLFQWYYKFIYNFNMDVRYRWPTTPENPYVIYGWVLITYFIELVHCSWNANKKSIKVVKTLYFQEVIEFLKRVIEWKF